MRAGLLIVLLLAVVALAPSATAEAEDQGLRPVLSDLSATYGSESWKDINATIGEATRGSPVQAPGPSETGVYSNPYSQPDHGHQPPDGNHLGYRVNANVTLVTSDGGSPPSDENYYIHSYLEAAAGTVPTRLAKLSNDTFEVLADLDGENRHGYPALTLGGDVQLQVEVYKESLDPSVDPQMVASDTFRLENHRGFSDPSGALFPEAQLPDYTDVGPTNFTEVTPSVHAPDERMTVSFRFPGAVEERAVARLHRGTSGATLVFTGQTDDEGRVEFSFTPRDALAAQDDTGLLVLETHLKGDARVLGSKAVVLPVSPHPMQVSSIEHEKRTGPGGDGNASTVQVTVQDSNDEASNNSRRGTLYVMKGTDVITDTSFGASPSTDPTVRSARYPATDVADYTSYEMVALFFDGRDDFYSLATAHRGASASLDVEDVEPNRQGFLNVTVSNENDNGNTRTDPGLVSTAQIEVRNLAGAADLVQDQVIVPEGESRTVEIPYTPSETGTHDFTVDVFAGEIALQLVGSVDVQESSLVDDILAEDDLLEAPGPGPAALLAGLVAAAAVLRRRQGSG